MGFGVKDTYILMFENEAQKLITFESRKRSKSAVKMAFLAVFRVNLPQNLPYLIKTDQTIMKWHRNTFIQKFRSTRHHKEFF